MSSLEIREIKNEELKPYQNLFLEGLEEESQNFRISPDDARNLPFPTDGKEDSFTLGAFVKNELVGIVSFQREGATREKLRHKGLLFRMYVNRNFSGQGIGSSLIEMVIDRAKQLPNMEQINLTVIASNPAAKHLYGKFGFESYSLEKNAVKFEGSYLDEESMVLFL